MNRKTGRAAALLACLLPLAAAAGSSVDVKVYDRTAGRYLPVYWHDGERHIAGEPGHEYEIRIRNRDQARVLAVTSVDGVNVITGRTANPRQSGYVIDPRGYVEIDGWRKSMAAVAAFYFTSLPDSYAARTGRPDDVGVIGVAVFRERQRQPAPLYRQSVPAADAEPLDPPSVPQERAAGKAAAAAQDSSAASGLWAQEERLGTGHGQRRDSGATYVDFERASKHPDEVITLYYDSYRNLVARGVIPKPKHRYAKRIPEPFPGGFVPDP